MINEVTVKPSNEVVRLSLYCKIYPFFNPVKTNKPYICTEQFGKLHHQQ